MPELLQPVPYSLFHTDPEVYYISTWGRLYNMRTNTFVPKVLMKEKNDYIIVQMRDVNHNELYMGVHRIVGHVFVMGKPVGNTKEIYINHIDGVKWHNEPYNLEWVTPSENIKHADSHKLIARPCGENNGYAALTDEQYHEICRLTQEGYMPAEVNKIMNIGKDITNIVQKIRTGKAETVISQQYDFSNIPHHAYWRISNEQAELVCKLLQNQPEMNIFDIIKAIGFNLDDLSTIDKYKLTTAIKNIKNRNTFTGISSKYIF